jgi:hypothetical protein
MRRWMHTCYTLVTREDSQTLILKSLSLLGLLHSLALQMCFSDEQMSKRPLKEVEGIYLYTPQTNPTVICRNSKTRTDRTRRSIWPDAPVKCNGRKPKVMLSDRTRRSEMTGRADQGWPNAPIMQELSWRMTWRTTASDHRWSDASGHHGTLLEHDRTRWSLHSHVRLHCLPSGTRVRLTTASGPLKDRVRSIS